MRARGFSIWAAVVVRGKVAPKKIRFAAPNANYPDQAAAKLASDAWLEEEMKRMVESYNLRTI